jgi:serine protease Do
MGLLGEIEQAVTGALKRAGATVVAVSAGRGGGCGVVVAPGQVLTNAHNLGGRQVSVAFTDGRVADGTVSGADLDEDLAVVAVDTGAVQPIDWAPGSPETGAPIVALANPAGRGLRATWGTVSATQRRFRGPRGRKVSGAIEHTAPLGRGSSGGPLLDVEGRLVGLNTHRLGDGFYLALPADGTLRARADALARGEASQRRRLGLALAPPPAARELRRAVGLEPRDGLLVRALDEDGPAARAGVRAGDLLVNAGGRSLRSIDDLHEVLDGGDGTLALGVLRGVDELAVAVTFGETVEEGSA